MVSHNLALIASSARDAFSRIHDDEAGQGMTEYVIILVAIAVVCIAIAVQFGGKIKALFETADSAVDTVDSGL